MPLQQSKSKTSFAKLLSAFVSLALLVGLGFAAANRQDIADWWTLREYKPPTMVAAIARETTMTDYGRKIFYVNKPEITTKANFRNVCPTDSTEHTIVLGCYHGNQSGIYLLHVDDPRLNGVEHVTAAHEMLHGAYERLSSKERKQLNAQLEDFYNNQLQDERILDTIDSYKKTEPNELVNEMHSIFGTEVRNLPTELETYYSRYFVSRAAVVSFAEHYQAEFTTRQDAIDRYDAQIDALKTQFDNEEAQLKTKQDEIDNLQAELLRLRNSNIAAYNAAVPTYNQLVDAYNAHVQQMKATIAEYNRLVEERNAVALEADELAKEINSEAVETIEN